MSVPRVCSTGTVDLMMEMLRSERVMTVCVGSEIESLVEVRLVFI